MVRRFRLFIMALVVLLVVPVSMVALAPASAEAEVNYVVWLNAAYKGSDPLLGYVQAYEAGSTATLKIFIQNTTEDDITINGVKVEFDWTGGEYEANEGDYPATLAQDETGTATISFTVPDISVASNLVPYDYTIKVDYDDGSEALIGMQITGDSLGVGDGFNTYFPTDYAYIDPGSLEVFLDGVLTTAWQCDFSFGGVRLNTAPEPGVSVTANYQIAEAFAYPDENQRVYYLGHHPVVPGSEKIYVDCYLMAKTEYSMDYDTGKITFDMPPTPAHNYAMRANYQYYDRWTYEGHNFAVYSTDQSAAMAAKQQSEAMGTPGVSTAASRELLAQSAMEEQLGDQQYASGNMEEARGHYEQAFTYKQDALARDKDPNDFNSQDPMGILLRGIGYLLIGVGVIFVGVVVCIIRKPKGPSSG